MTRRRLLSVVGVVALGLAVAVAAAPVPAVIRGTVANASVATVVFGTAALLALLGMAGLVSTDWLARLRPSGRERGAVRGRFDVNGGPFSIPSSTPPDPAGTAETDEADDEQERDVRVAGESVDEALSRLAAPKRRESWSINDDRWEVRSRVRGVAETVLVEHDGLDPETASVRLDEGTWTDDPRAAAFLGDATPPPAVRVVDWLSGRPFERRARAAVAELAARADADTEVEIA
jgi:hypothetical protein